MSHDENEDEDYFIPLQDQRVFGAGIKRKRIAFVPAATSTEPSFVVQKDTKPTNAGDRYLSIVLNKQKAPADTGERAVSAPPVLDREELCAVCKQPLPADARRSVGEAHESSIAHQVCLQHVHPPSHLDRQHVGVKYLAEYGWDPDSRKGLGARQEGIVVPIKAKAKKDTVGLGHGVQEEESLKKRRVAPKREGPIVKLNAKEVRKREDEARKRADRLRHSLYGPDLEKYLGPG